jgi:ribose 5-phosphate isomerase A
MINAKQVAAAKAIEYIQNGMVVGLGTGSTAYWAIEYAGAKVKEGLDIRAIATSVQTETLAKGMGIPIISFADTDHIDITIDGADEVDAHLQLIKGGGGALVREKIVAAVSNFYIIIVDETKLVTTLGKFKLPVEILRFGHEITMRHLKELGTEPGLRMTDNKIFITDNGNYIVDCSFGMITDPPGLHEKINGITGVVDNGLFINKADLVIAGDDKGNTRILKRELKK